MARRGALLTYDTWLRAAGDCAEDLEGSTEPLSRAAAERIGARVATDIRVAARAAMLTDEFAQLPAPFDVRLISIQRSAPRSWPAASVAFRELATRLVSVLTPIAPNWVPDGAASKIRDGWPPNVHDPSIKVDRRRRTGRAMRGGGGRLPGSWG
jgi:hypothetical protein